MTYPVAGRMADSTRPNLIPDKFALRPNGVLIYVDGSYKWDARQIRRFPRHWNITTTGDVSHARTARCIDVERFDASPADVPEYAAARAKFNDRTVVYCDRSTVPAVVSSDPTSFELLWFIATLDGRNWNPATLAADIAANEGVQLDPRKIRAIQYLPGESFDTSLLFGDPEWP